MKDIGMKTKRRFVEVVIVCVLLCLVTPLYADTPWLHTDANLIKDPNGNVVVLRGLDTIDIGTVAWYMGANNLIDYVTNKNETEGNSPGWYPRVIRLAVYPAQETDFFQAPSRSTPTTALILIIIIFSGPLLITAKQRTSMS